MKKKFLSLMMAAAMVATTSVSAFADKVIDSTPHTATGAKKVVVSEEGEGQNSEINIRGDIADTGNNLAPSTISVTVPTAAKFTVDNGGNLVGSNINITSEGSEPVSVIAYKFIDITPKSNITVVEENDVKTATDRKKVSLKLTGNRGSVALKTETDKNNKGVYKIQESGEGQESSVGQETGASEELVIGSVKSDSPLKLSLTGTANKSVNAPQTPVEDSFTLILKLKKER